MLTTYMKGREAAAGPGFSINPPSIYSYRGVTLHPTLCRYVDNGTVEVLSGKPSPGIDVIEITAAMLDAGVRPEAPPPAPMMERAALCKRLGITVNELGWLVGRPFPEPTDHIGGPSAAHPDDTARARWSPAVIEQWLRDNPLLRNQSAGWGE